MILEHALEVALEPHACAGARRRHGASPQTRQLARDHFLDRLAIREIGGAARCRSG